MWIVNLPWKSVELYSEPAGGAYQISRTFRRGADAQPHSLADVCVQVSEGLG